MNQIKKISNQSNGNIVFSERIASELKGNTQIFDLVDMAIAFHQNGMLEEASLIYEKILIKDPGHIDAMNLLGLIALQKKEYPQAIDLINKAILASPHNNVPEFHANLGCALHQEKLFDESIASFDLAISLNPSIALYHTNRGLAQLEKKYFDSAINSFDQAISLSPEDSRSFYYRGLAQLEKKYFDSAINSFDQAIKLRGDFSEAFNNRGIAQLGNKYFDSAINSFDQAIQLRPDYSEALWNKGLVLLKLGRFEEGWVLYEERLKGSPSFPFARHESLTNFIEVDKLADKSVLLFSEQGIGDTIQFYRYVKKIANLDARVTVAVQKSLVDLFSLSKPLWNIVNIEGALPACDYRASLLSLPFVLQENSIDINADNPYIFSSSIKVSEWKNRLGPKQKAIVGIVWSGNTLFKENGKRSIPLLQMISFLPSDLQYVSLQKELSDFDLKALEKNAFIANYASYLTDFNETAALIDCLDLVITVDTSIAHLAGAMGKKAWLLLSDNADWRWFIDTESSPWYPTIKIFRQEEAGDWSRALKRVELELIAQFR
jgi:tetratricopeptide (TPR) repeat protein